MGTRTHQVELAAEDVHELRELIEAEPPQPLAEPRDPMVIVTNPLGGGEVRRVHRSELEQSEGLAGAPHTLLNEEHGPWGFELDRHRDQGEQRCEKDDA